jgi:hypothetical protein
MSWVITPSNLLVDDQDALTYLAAVETADGQALESGVRLAVNAFVKGCKNDGIWPAIKASCILAGARTLQGALVPLVGTAPTNNGPFVNADYDRETGLQGDGNTKFLSSNRANNADPQANAHHAVYATSIDTVSGRQYIAAGGNRLVQIATNNNLNTRVNDATSNSVTSGNANGFIGVSRGNPLFYTTRANQTTSAAVNVAVTTHPNNTVLIFSGNNAPVNARLAFYSIGESLDLALLDARVTTLVNAFAAAIP